MARLHSVCTQPHLHAHNVTAPYLLSHCELFKLHKMSPQNNSVYTTEGIILTIQR